MKGGKKIKFINKKFGNQIALGKQAIESDQWPPCLKQIFPGCSSNKKSLWDFV